MLSWRNWIAHPTTNRKVASSNLAESTSTHGRVAKLVHAAALEAVSERTEGSTPSLATNKNAPVAKLVETHWT